MKRLSYLCVILTLLLSGCVTEMPISDTENYLRTKIQKHETLNSSDLKMYPFKFSSASGRTLEAYGYIKENQKFVLFAPRDAEFNLISYYILDETEVRTLLAKYAELKSTANQNNYLSGEIYSLAYDVNDELFIGIRATSSIPSSVIEFWFNKETKFSLSAQSTIEKLNKFINGRSVNSPSSIFKS